MAELVLMELIGEWLKNHPTFSKMYGVGKDFSGYECIFSKVTIDNYEYQWAVLVIVDNQYVGIYDDKNTYLSATNPDFFKKIEEFLYSKDYV